MHGNSVKADWGVAVTGAGAGMFKLPLDLIRYRCQSLATNIPLSCFSRALSLTACAAITESRFNKMSFAALWLSFYRDKGARLSYKKEYSSVHLSKNCSESTEANQHTFELLLQGPQPQCLCCRVQCNTMRMTTTSLYHITSSTYHVIHKHT